MTSASDSSDRRYPAQHHSILDDVVGIGSGVFAASLGLYLLHSAGVVTGGTAGLSLLLAYATPVPFGVLFMVVNLPFFVLAVRQRGWNFTIRTVISVAAVSALTPLHPAMLGTLAENPVYGAVAGNLLAGIGLLILFRHHASLGGFNIMALIIQDRWGWRAGYVQMALDVIIVAASFSVTSPMNVLLSAIGAVIMNLVIALNHRPGRYLGF
ncbi:YitT family protein [Pseudoclavibacter sp. CFCC 11306]|uniref:YitT family protein n=1 Tax=Pseudoclavibacter sp. CFCC 11306 TaxID=1564493 RepID=UPI0013017687|nr:YitT family protein [Pseudoclavibacter sp. CFCC 11306]KAB1658519.1 YitT family protein [Pseudoclavibacter sp. CFCC 11306]